MDAPVHSRRPRRQAFLFLVAIVVPCLVLVALGLRLMAQERQLKETRRAEQLQLLVVQVRQELLSRLEKIRQQEVARAATSAGNETPPGRQSAVAFVGAWVDGRLRLPWEGSPDALRFRASLNEPGFADEIRQGEADELAARQYESAVRHYEAALVAARQPARRTYARLLRARALGKLGRRTESLTEYEAVLASPSGQAGSGQASFQDLGRFLVTGTDADRELRPLALSADDRRALVAFLESLSGKVYDGVTPRVVR